MISLSHKVKLISFSPKRNIMGINRLSEVLSILNQNRFCDQDNFDLIISRLQCGPRPVMKTIHKLQYPSFTNAELLYSTSEFEESNTDLWF